MEAAGTFHLSLKIGAHHAADPVEASLTSSSGELVPASLLLPSSGRHGSNVRPPGPRPGALPAELRPVARSMDGHLPLALHRHPEARLGRLRRLMVLLVAAERLVASLAKHSDQVVDLTSINQVDEHAQVFSRVGVILCGADIDVRLLASPLHIDVSSVALVGLIEVNPFHWHLAISHLGKPSAVLRLDTCVALHQGFEPRPAGPEPTVLPITPMEIDRTLRRTVQVTTTHRQLRPSGEGRVLTQP